MKTKISGIVVAIFILIGIKAQIPTNGLVLNLALDGIVADSSIYKNTCENNGATPVADRTGRAGKAMAFDGYSYIRIPSTKVLDLTNNRTLSCWAYIPSTMIPYMYPTLIYKKEPIKGSATYCIQLCECSCYDSNQHKITSLSTTELTHYQTYSKELYTDYYNSWIHVVSTYDTISGYLKIYLNGHISDSTYCGKIVSNSSNQDLTIGCGGLSSDYRTFFNGYIDDVLLYNRALSAAEILDIYNEKFAVNAGADKNIICGERVKLDSVTSNYSGEGSLKYKWTPAIGLDNDSIANPTCSITTNMTYTVTVKTPSGLTANDNISVNQKEFSSINSTAYTYITCGEAAKFDTILTNYKGTGRLKYEWTPSSGLNSDTIARPICSALQSTAYNVKITTPTGCTTNAYVYAYVSTNPSYYSTYKSISCGDTLKLEAITPNTTNKTGLHYKWLPKTGLNNDTIATPITNLLNSIIYQYTVTNSLGCIVSYGNVDVTFTKKTKPLIAVVGVNTKNKNFISWDKSGYSNIAKFNIYKENNSGYTYTRIGSVSYDSTSTFIDSLSSPNMQSSKYKLSMLDKCGTETDLSDYHKTMYLTVNKQNDNALNLTWEPYEGYVVSAYNIYRGSSANNISKIGTLSGSNNQFTDFTAPSGDVYYQIEAVKLVSPLIGIKNKTEINSAIIETSRSNIASNTNISLGTNIQTDISELISIYPNPATLRLDLEVKTAMSTDLNYYIYNMLGEVVRADKIVTNKQHIILDNLNSGIYNFVVRSEKMIGSHKLIIQK